jgi:AbrB family looped-hinge helix DNA binding protein
MPSNIASVSTKGRVTLPAEFRRRLRIHPGDKVVIEATENAIVIWRTVDFFDLEGFLGKGLSPAKEHVRMVAAALRRAQGRAR